MTEKRLLFGDKNTADIKLRLIGSDGADYGGNPVYLHSQVLAKSGFYKAMLSERWSSGKRSVEVEGTNSQNVDDKQPQPLEVEATSFHSMDDYIKCIKLMYSSEASESLCFSSVDEALAILPVASELLFHDYIQECMEYLDAVRWSREQENLLGALLSFLQINMLPSLAARLGMSPCKSQCEHLEALEGFLPHMLFLIMTGQENRYGLTRDGIEKYIVGYFKGNTSAAIADKCKSVLLKDIMDNIEHIKSNNNDKDKKNRACSALLWLIGVIRQCDGKLFQNVLYLFCEDTDLGKALTSIKSENHKLELATVNTLMNSFLEAMGNGEIVTPSSFRLSFLKNWVGTMITLISGFSRHDRNKYLEMLAALDKGIANLAETLSFGDQKLIYNIWINAFMKHPMHPCIAIQWWAAKLQDAITRHH